MIARKTLSTGSSPLIGTLRRHILDSGVSLNELARRTGVSDPQLSRFVRGTRSLTLPAAEKLAIYFGLSLGKQREPITGKSKAK
jgi:transcriptional regulator with XRE-family HTH domain